ncbi:MAG: hypothetical protein J7L53_07755 [Deltaproteobacteria bacterium]|nr:hypothetical protein [Deltaproteobacteria bacterium]
MDTKRSNSLDAAVCMRQEDGIRERVDDKGNKWWKVYFGGGAHFRNWLDQCREIFGEENIEIEEVDFTGLKCFEESGEKAYRIWVKQRGD